MSKVKTDRQVKRLIARIGLHRVIAFHFDIPLAQIQRVTR